MGIKLFIWHKIYLTQFPLHKTHTEHLTVPTEDFFISHHNLQIWQLDPFVIFQLISLVLREAIIKKRDDSMTAMWDWTFQ